MLLHRLVFLLSFAMSLVSAADYRTLEGMEIRSRFRKVHEPSCGDEYTLATCYSTYCKSNICAVEFDNKTGGCITVKDKYLKIISVLIKTGALMQRKTGKSVAVPKGTQLITNTAPEGLWTFDSSHTGMNFGSKGSSLNCNTAGLRWDSNGPRGSLKYAKLTAQNRAYFDLVVGGKRILSLQKAVTISLWVRTDNKNNGWMSILAPDKPAFQWMFRNKQKLMVNLGINKFLHYSKVDNSIDTAKWRHIAMVYQHSGEFRFYQNAKVMAMENENNSGKQQGLTEPSRLRIGYRYTKSNNKYDIPILGSMACLSIFTRALTQDEIKIMMNSCP